ncbi:MAG: glycosyltransferase family 39 protein [Chloroflexota bacterium]|nr:glycosyltransferase family 39 protein [Chloroflexota bacterium]
MSEGFFTPIKSFAKAWGATLISITAWAVYLLQAVNLAHKSDSILDEGAYLLKGLLFVTGRYTPYQEYGPWTNKMPLSFLIPGVVQDLFGPDIGVGRYFAIFLSGLMLLGLWLLANRLGGKWWAAGIVCVYAINPFIIYDYSLAVSQVLVACMLVWMLVLVLGDERKTWQIALGAVLAGAIVMTRINMFMVVPLLILYIYWQYGKRAALIATISSAVPIIIGNAIYWPDILHRYAILVPRSITPFLDPWRTPKQYSPIWNPTIDPISRLLSLLQATRIHFISIMGTLIAWLLWPRKRDWKKESNYRSAVFISVLFISLLLFHLWVALGNDFCTYCLSGYLSFFSFLGILLIILTFPGWRRRLPIWLQIILVFLVVLLSIVFGYSTFPEVGYQLLETKIPETLFTFPEFELVKLKKFLRVEHYITVKDARRQVPAFLGLVVGMIILAFGYEQWFRYKRKHKADVNTRIPCYGYWLLIAFLIVGTLITPAYYYYNTLNTDDCGTDVIAAYKAAGEHLAEQIPPGSLVYWRGGESVVPLLYVPEINIYPPQINGAYSYKLGGYSDPDSVLKLGYWNSVLDYNWQREADYLLVQDGLFNGPLKWYIMSFGEFEELERTPAIVQCDDKTRIRIFQRKH